MSGWVGTRWVGGQVAAHKLLKGTETQVRSLLHCLPKQLHGR